MEDTMHNLGMKRKELDGMNGAKPMETKDYEKEIVYPKLDARGKQAEMLGADELEEGEYLKQTVIWKVDRIRKVEENGKKDYDLCLCMVKASDMEPVEAPKEEKKSKEKASDDDDGEKSEVSPGMAVIMGKSEDY